MHGRRARIDGESWNIGHVQQEELGPTENARFLSPLLYISFANDSKTGHNVTTRRRRTDSNDFFFFSTEWFCRGPVGRNGLVRGDELASVLKLPLC